MNKQELKIDLILKGEPAYFLKMVHIDTKMEYEEIFSKMIDLYKQVYLNQNELAWVEGDKVIDKVNSDNLRRRN